MSFCRGFLLISLLSPPKSLQRAESTRPRKFIDSKFLSAIFLGLKLTGIERSSGQHSNSSQSYHGDPRRIDLSSCHSIPSKPNFFYSTFSSPCSPPCSHGRLQTSRRDKGQHHQHQNLSSLRDSCSEIFGSVVRSY